MKCPNCGGNGRLEVEDNGVVMQGVYWRCPTCGGKGIVEPLNNEEYLKSCNTEQLAEFITDIVYECKEQDDCMDCKLGWCSCNYVAKWLKEKHHD